ncbi:MAG: mechanosensitive ion channel [Thermoproteota archaeon]|nr:mechanosensitive ion channel [Candidatus Brockarchaeota archaeon]
MASKNLEKHSVAKESSKAIVKVVVYIVLYVVVTMLVQYIFFKFLPQYQIFITDYAVYANILIALAFGYLIVSGIANFIYWTLRVKYTHSTAVAVRNVIKIIGIGGLAAAIAGGVAGGAAGVALGGFLGMVIGFATQQVLGQAVAGLFVLIVRPFKIGDSVIVAGEEGVVEDVATLFTTVVKSDGTRALIPNNTVLSGKIYVKQQKQD